MNLYSNAGQYIVADVTSPKWMDLSPGLAYSIALVNTTAADITAGSFTIQTTGPSADDPCVPDDAGWQDLEEIPECDALPSAVVGPAKFTLSASNPLPAGGQCHIAAPCPEPFIRVVVTGATGVTVLGVLTRLRGSAAAVAAAA